jgi:hypothetical protein
MFPSRFVLHGSLAGSISHGVILCAPVRMCMHYASVHAGKTPV